MGRPTSSVAGVRRPARSPATAEGSGGVGRVAGGERAAHLEVGSGGHPRVVERRPSRVARCVAGVQARGQVLEAPGRGRRAEPPVVVDADERRTAAVPGRLAVGPERRDEHGQVVRARGQRPPTEHAADAVPGAVDLHVGPRVGRRRGAQRVELLDLSRHPDAVAGERQLVTLDADHERQPRLDRPGAGRRLRAWRVPPRQRRLGQLDVWAPVGLVVERAGYRVAAGDGAGQEAEDVARPGEGERRACGRPVRSLRRCRPSRSG